MNVALFPLADPAEFFNWYVAYGPEYGTVVELYQITTESAAYRPDTGETLIQRSYITGPSQNGNPHRSYPCFSVYNTQGMYSPMTAPVPRSLFAFDVYLRDCTIDHAIGQWFSLATVTPDPSNVWHDVITLNVNGAGKLNIAFKRNKDIGLPGTEYVEEEIGTSFTQNAWHRFDILIDYDTFAPNMVTAWVYMDGRIVKWPSGDWISRPIFSGWTGSSQFHAGLYCHRDILQGTLYQDNVLIAQL